MGRRKAELAESTLEEVLSDGVDRLESMCDEMQDIIDNASGTNRENTQFIQSLTDSCDSLRSAVDNFDKSGIPDYINEIKVTYIKERRSDEKSRAARRDYAVMLIQACKDALEEWLDEADAKNEEDEGWVEEIGNIIDEAESVDFPGRNG